MSLTMSSVLHQSATQEATVRDYFALLKPRVMTLVVFSGIAGLVVAPGTIHPFLAFIAIVSLAIGAGASGAINMWYDRDIDAIMTRTQNRPIPKGVIEPAEALAFGGVLTLFSVMLMGMAVNWVAAFLLAFASFFYVYIYTIWLKRKTPQNIVIGGAAGAFPPMIGWAAVTGDVSVQSVLLFAIIFFWTPPHFWALALFKNDDYKKANVPMLPVVAGAHTTKIHMLVYTLILLPLTLAPYAIEMVSFAYVPFILILNALFIYYAVKVLKSEQMVFAKQMFAYSIFYLFAVFTVLMLTAL